MKVISLDPSLRSFGIYYNRDGERSSETISLPNSYDRLDVLAILTYRFAAISKEGWDLVIVEAYAYGRANSRSITVQAEIGGLVRGLFGVRKVPIIEVPIGVWKSVTGIREKKGTATHKSDYLNAVHKLFGERFTTTDEADAMMIYQTVKTCGMKPATIAGAVKIRQRLEDLKIKAEEL